MSLTQEIKEFALDLGYTAVGITSAEGFPDYASELQSRPQMYTWFIEGPRQPLRGAEPRSLMPAARSIVSVVYDYGRTAFPEKLVGKIGRLYLARCYNAPPHRIHGARRRLMQEFLEKRGCDIGLNVVVPERMTAARAGVATYGRNTFSYAGDSGSFIVLTSFVVDAELEIDPPTMETGCPTKCRACMDACPTAAIYEPLRMDPRRCIAFNTFTTQESSGGGITSHIPVEIREKMGSWIHGCDLCQQACPRNRKSIEAVKPADPFLETLAEAFDLRKVLRADEAFFGRVIQPLMYNYLKEKRHFQRNAAIALGNTRDPQYLPDLAGAMDDPEPLVRAYAAWAIGRIGGGEAKAQLEAASKREMVRPVQQEILAALGRA
jgi:epoxyqueuosine reductase